MHIKCYTICNLNRTKKRQTNKKPPFWRFFIIIFLQICFPDSLNYILHKLNQPTTKYLLSTYQKLYMLKSTLQHLNLFFLHRNDAHQPFPKCFTTKPKISRPLAKISRPYRKISRPLVNVSRPATILAFFLAARRLRRFACKECVSLRRRAPWCHLWCDYWCDYWCDLTSKNSY